MRNQENYHQVHSNLYCSFGLKLAVELSGESPSFIIIVLGLKKDVIAIVVRVIALLIEFIEGIDSQFLR